jgi:tRNA-Thr(GGU) m(6)t(6)A37 methyltransferase TsaA
VVNEGSFGVKLEERYAPALREMDGFSHVIVLWWCHHVDGQQYRRLTELEKPYKRSPAKVGVFATRSPVRPNPIAATAVAVLKVDHEAGIIQIPYIDAEHGSPVLDIKPYHPCADRIREVSVPEWCSHWPEWYEDSAQFDWSAEFVGAQ